MFEPRAERPAVTEFDILKVSHKFLRDDTERKDSASWNDQLARKYYDSLYREFAICDLKHYKSGNFALRWRTESEVLDGIGETSCANTRCEYHRSPSPSDLSTLELPFTYQEHGEQKEALVKIVLCPKCVRKLMWKRRKDRRNGKQKDVEEGPVTNNELIAEASPNDRLRQDSVVKESLKERRRSRSQSPRWRGGRSETRSDRS